LVDNRYQNKQQTALNGTGNTRGCTYWLAFSICESWVAAPSRR
jgi:hypothetical protein